MKESDAGLHPSHPDHIDDLPASARRERRRPGSWCRQRRELLMLACIGTLAALLLLVKLPLGGSFFRSDDFSAFVAATRFLDEPLPLITAHEVQPRTPTRPTEKFLPYDVLPESDFAPDELTHVELDRPGINTRVAPQRATAVASLTLGALANTSRYMHTAITAPRVDDPPRLRIGSLLIDYPLSALKKAIEGLIIVRFTVETDGRAYGIDIVSGLEPACDAAVVNALRDARFIPGQSSGRDVPALAQTVVRFTIEEASGFY